MLRSTADLDIAALVTAKVTAMGDGVLSDLDGVGTDSIGKYNFFGNDSEAQRCLIIPLADGLIPNKVIDIEITNGLADTLSVYMPVLKRGSLYVQNLQQTILANSQSVFENFTALFLDTLDGVGNQITIDWSDGTSHTFDNSEIGTLNYFFQSNNKTVINNDDGRIKKVTVIPNADKVIYLQRFRKVANL